MDEIKEILRSILPDTDLDKETALFEDGILNSMDVVELITRLCDTFEIELGPRHLVPENFNSVEAMWKMVQSILDEE
jgi:acyl carrier protein